MVKKRATRIRNWLSSRGTSPETIPNPVPVPAPAKLSAGDRVRVRSIGEIQSTLDTWGELRHCAFMPEMVPYCDTEQRVFKRLERFLDERDYKVKKASGIVLLEGVMCEGTKFFGQCDRSCFFFWREEWLEKTE
jgi:hypothetical protein